MDRSSLFADLRNVLAALYTDEASARRVVDDAGLAALPVRCQTTSRSAPMRAISTEKVAVRAEQ